MTDPTPIDRHNPLEHERDMSLAYMLKQTREDALEECAARIEALEAERRNIISHASMGHTTGEGMGLNDVCVAITAQRNALYQAIKADLNTAIAAAYEAAAVKLDDHNNAPCRAVGDWQNEDYITGQIDATWSWQRAIRAMSPADAIAARDADRALVRRQALEEAAALTRKHIYYDSAGTGFEVDDFEAAIRAMIKEEGDE